MSARPPAPPKRGARKTSSKPIRLIVRRGAQHRFDALKRKAKNLNVVIEWDRREGDRRQSDERGDQQNGATHRHEERRQKPPFTWDSADFVVVIDQDDPESGKPKKKE